VVSGRDKSNTVLEGIDVQSQAIEIWLLTIITCESNSDRREQQVIVFITSLKMCLRDGNGKLNFTLNRSSPIQKKESGQTEADFLSIKCAIFEF
jgi:hypothetical protein